VLLWFGPFALLLIGAGVLVFQLRKRRQTVQETVLTPEAQQRAASLLNEEENK
jgi:cytochrome c-type biogenesis protein CcmH